MAKNTIDEIAERLKKDESMAPGAKSELLGLLGDLKREISALPQSVSDDAKSIAGFTEISAHEATRADRKQERLAPAIKGLEESVKGFEASHPKLVEIVNRISMMFSDIGI